MCNVLREYGDDINSSSLSVCVEEIHCMTVMTQICLLPDAAGTVLVADCVPWKQTKQLLVLKTKFICVSYSIYDVWVFLRIHKLS